MAIANKDTMTLEEFDAEMAAADRLWRDIPVARDLSNEITDFMYAGILDNYVSSSTAWGAPWPPHAPYTVQKYGPHPLLILTGAMLAASTQSGVEGNYLEVNDRDLTIGVTLPYAAAQQFGTDKIPARPFFDLPEDAIQRIEKLVGDYFVQQVVG